MATRQLEQPAFYALGSRGWRGLLTLLHPPYTAWHLSYVAIGAALAPSFHADRLGWTVGAFFLGVGVCAHALDELHGHPLRTELSDRTLKALAGMALSGAVGIGALGALTVSPWIWPLTAAGAFIVIAYNLELFGGRFHSDMWFAAAWGGFPALVGFWANSQQVQPEGVLGVVACFMLSVAQRRLSTPVRELRRRTVAVSGEQRLSDGRSVQLDAARLAAPMDRALGACALGIVLLAVGMVVARL